MAASLKAAKAVMVLILVENGSGGGYRIRCGCARDDGTPYIHSSILFYSNYHCDVLAPCLYLRLPGRPISIVLSRRRPSEKEYRKKEGLSATHSKYLYSRRRVISGKRGKAACVAAARSAWRCDKRHRQQTVVCWQATSLGVWHGRRTRQVRGGEKSGRKQRCGARVLLLTVSVKKRSRGWYLELLAVATCLSRQNIFWASVSCGYLPGRGANVYRMAGWRIFSWI